MFVTLSYHIINHAISDSIAIAEEAFEQQLAYLHAQGYAALSLAQAIADIDGIWQAPARAVLLTFDDGYVDTLHAALPRLQAYAMRATLFVITGYIGQSNRWNTRACYDTQHMTWDEICHWHESGGDLGGHSHLHHCMTRLSLNELKDTVEQNKRLLEKETGVTPRAFAYPYGRFNQAVIDVVRKHYEVAFATDGGAWDAGAHRYTINRLTVSPAWTIEEYAKQLRSIYLFPQHIVGGHGPNVKAERRPQGAPPHSTLPPPLL
jgi:peptidoglycan/xylan/chitin deacetylase (PgdA/CDA1 family)